MSMAEKVLNDKLSRAATQRDWRAMLDQQWLRGVIGLIVFAALWEAVGHSGSGLFFAPFSSVVLAAIQLYGSGEIWVHIGATLTNYLAGLALGIALAIPLGLLLGWNRKALDYVDPIISIALSTPVIVLVPLVIATFGIFWQSKVAITCWAVFFPVLVSMIAGVQSVDTSLVRVARSFRANDLQIIRDIVLPGTVPTLAGGLRLGMTHGLIGCLAAEFFGAPRGLGYLAFSYGQTYQPAQMLVAVLTMAVLGIIITTVMHAVQRRADAWRVDQR